MRKTACLLAAVAATMTLAAADDPYAFTYRGVLCDSRGGRLPSESVKITFRLYATRDRAEALWGRTTSVRLGEEGLFSALLSDSSGEAIEVAPIPRYESLSNALAAATSGELYLGLTPSGAAEELSPRQAVLTAPFATVARNVTASSGDFTVGATASAPRVSAESASVTGALAVRQLQVSGSLRTLGKLTAGGDLTVASGNLASAGNATVGGGATASGAFMAGSVTVRESATVDGALTAGSVEAASVTVGGVRADAPLGLIILWYGSADAIPRGWSLCDGNNGTPDLRDRFIVGAGGDEYELGARGGEDTVTLTVETMPAHTHGVSHYGYGYALSHNTSDEVTGRKWKNNSKEHTSDNGGTAGAAHENRPAYHALYYIQRTAE